MTTRRSEQMPTEEDVQQFTGRGVEDVQQSPIITEQIPQMTTQAEVQQLRIPNPNEQMH